MRPTNRVSAAFDGYRPKSALLLRTTYVAAQILTIFVEMQVQKRPTDTAKKAMILTQTYLYQERRLLPIVIG
jgi:hypothetical protein